MFKKCFKYKTKFDVYFKPNMGIESSTLSLYEFQIIVWIYMGKYPTDCYLKKTKPDARQQLKIFTISINSSSNWFLFYINELTRFFTCLVVCEVKHKCNKDKIIEWSTIYINSLHSQIFLKKIKCSIQDFDSI